MTDLQKEFEATGYTSWINADLYPDGKIYTKEYTEWLEKKVQALRQPPVVGSVSLTEGQIAHQIEMDEEEDSYWMDDDDYEDEIIGYECLACGHIHNYKPMDGCDKCLSYSVDAMYG